MGRSLSYNFFRGVVPQAFSKLTNLQYLYGALVLLPLFLGGRQYLRASAVATAVTFVWKRQG